MPIVRGLAIACLALLAACGGGDGGGSGGAERVLTIRYWQAPSIPNTYLSTGTKDTDAGAVTLEPLASYTPEGDLTPRLAAIIPTVANGGVAPDLTSITWTLRDGLQWSDGSDMTAEDVVFTWRYCTDEATGCTAIDSFSGIVAVEAPDELTVRITFDAPTPYPYSAFVGAGVPIISRAQFGDCVGAAATICHRENLEPLGTGPYRILTFDSNEGATYERNPHYRGETPYFERVEIIGGGTAVDAASAVLVTGEADYAWNLQVPPDTLAALGAEGIGTLVTAFAGDVERIVVNHSNPDPALEAARSEYLDGQNPHPFLTFPPITQAMSMAIDRAGIAALYGFAAVPTCNLIAGPPRYASTANDACLTQDIEGANRLLDEHGVVDSNGDGIREHEGEPLRVTYQTSTNEIRQDTQALVRDWWAAIGIETELIDHDSSVFFGGDPVIHPDASLRRFFADVQMFTSGPGIDPQEHLSGGLCAFIQSRENYWSGGNVARWCNPDYDRLYDDLTRATDEAEREVLVKQLNDMAVGGYAQLPLVHRGNVSAHADSLVGVRINGWDSELWNIAEWRRD